MRKTRREVTWKVVGAAVL